MSPADELRHLREGAGGAPAPGELDELQAECPNGAGQALARIRQVLERVIERSTGEWPGLEEWKAILPAWFVESCVDDVQVRDCVIDRWSLRAWIYWFQPGQRRWRWWDASPGERSLGVRILVLERPYLRGALEWLLKVSA